MLNARTIEAAFPSCGYVVLQASNMAWVRPGMVQFVRQQRFSLTRQLARHLCGDACGDQDSEYIRNQREPAVPELLRAFAAPRGQLAMQFHEGSFLPLSELLMFRVEVERAVSARRPANLATLILDQPCCTIPGICPGWGFCLEEWLLPTWLVNYRSQSLSERLPNVGPMCAHTYAADGRMANVTTAVASAIRQKASQLNDQQMLFAVKRVARNLSDPETQGVLTLIRSNAKREVNFAPSSTARTSTVILSGCNARATTAAD